MTDIGELVVRIKADASQLQQELAKASGSVKESAGGMEKAVETLKEQLLELVPALSVAAFVEFGKSAIETASNLQNMADRIGFSASTLSALQPMLAKTGSSVDEFAHSVYMMNNFIQQAIDGNPKAIKTLDDLGLSATKLKAMQPEDAMNEMVDAIFRLGNITEQTAAGREVFSRQWATLIPLMKESNGDLGEHIEKQKELGNALSDEKIARIHEFGVSLEDAGIRAKNAFLSAFASILAVNDEIQKVLVKPGTNAKSGMPGENPLPDDYIKKAHSLGMVTEATFASRGNEQFGPAYRKPSARGNNDDIAQDGDDAKEAAEQLGPYIDKLNEEAQAAEVSEKALFIKRAEIEATTKAQNDYNNDLRDSAGLTAQETQQVDAAAAALYDHKEALAQNKQIADQLTNSLTKIVMNFKDMKSAITDLFDSIAQEIIKTNVAKPLASSITGALPSGGLGGIFSGFTSLLGFAGGGSPPVGVPSVVGENGPELFVPNQAGTVVPNGAMGGQTVVVQQSFSLNPGATEQTVAQLRNLAPSIAAQAHASVMQAIQKGGAESRIVGKRS